MPLKETWNYQIFPILCFLGVKLTIVAKPQIPNDISIKTLCMNPKNSFDLYHIWLAPRHILNVPTLIVTCTTVKFKRTNFSAVWAGYQSPVLKARSSGVDGLLLLLLALVHSGWKVSISVWCMQIILQYDVRWNSAQIETFFTQAKISKVLNLYFYFFV